MQRYRKESFLCLFFYVMFSVLVSLPVFLMSVVLCYCIVYVGVFSRFVYVLCSSSSLY